MSRPPVQTDIVEASRVVRTPHLVADRVTTTVLDGVLAPPLPANAIFTTLTVSGVSSLGPTSISNLGVAGPLTVDVLSATGNLFVAGTSSLAGVSADTVQTNGLDVVANAVVGGTLGLTGNLTAASDAAVGGDLAVAGNATVTGNSGVVGNATVDGTLYVAGEVSTPSGATVGGDLAVSGSAAVSTNLTVTGTADVTGALTASADVSVGANLDVTGTASVTGNLTVLSNAAVSGTVSGADPTLGGHLTTLNYVRRQAEVTRVTISAASIPNNSPYTMPFDTVQWDPNGNWNTGTFTYTVPKPGFYAISLAIRAPLPSGYLRCYLQSGTDFSYGTEVGAVTGGSTTSTLSTVYGFGGGDTFTVIAFQTSGAPLAPQAGFRFTYLSIAYLGEIAAL